MYTLTLYYTSGPWQGIGRTWIPLGSLPSAPVDTARTGASTSSRGANILTVA